MLTVSEFQRLSGEQWSHSFVVKLGIRARALHLGLYGALPRKVRNSKMPSWRGKVGKFPCGVLEQAYRELTTGQEIPKGKLHYRLRPPQQAEEASPAEQAQA